MKIKFLFGCVSFSIIFMACEQAKPPSPNQILKPTTNSMPASAANSINAAPSVSVPDKPKIKTYDGKGKVTKINLELVSVELNHEEIKDLMPKMTMEFYVKEKSQLEKLKVGDVVDFVLEDNAGAEQIISIKKSK
jgi:Cu(I)/Ag(I) efflux system protein CusF